MTVLRVFGASQPFCDGLSRRDFLTVGALGVGGLSVADVLRLRTAARGAAAARPRVRAVIMVVLNGGLSHIDSYDLKPGARRSSAASSGRSRPTSRASTSAS